MGLILVLLIYGIPIVLAIFGVIFLIRSTMHKHTYINKKPERRKSRARVIDKVEYYGSNPTGFYQYYRLTLELLENEKIEMKVPKNVINKVDVNDIVMVTFEGDKFVSIDIVEKLGEKAPPRSIMAKRWDD